MDQDISPEWYRLCNVHMVCGSTICDCMLLQGKSIQPLLEASCQTGSKERGAKIKVCINIIWVVLAN